MVRPRLSLRAKALALLAAREYSRKELARKLATHARKAREADAAGSVEDNEMSSPQADIDTLLDEFSERGWLSEARYVEQAVRRLSRRYGPRRVAQDLESKGISRESVAASLPYLNSEALGSAKALLERKFRDPAHSPEDRARRVRFLQGRGFDYDVIRNVLKNQQYPEIDDES
jgi:regulatory protein